MKWSGPGGARVAALLSAGALVLAVAAPGHATVDESRACRKTIGKELSKLANTQTKGLDNCYKAEHKLDSSPADCNVLGATFDPDGKYAAAKTKANGKVNPPTGKCIAGDPVLGNYVPAGDPVADAVPGIETDVFGNSLLVAGNRDLGDPKVNKVDVKCNETIGKNRTKIVKEVLKESTKCQDAVDKVGTSFGVLDPTCVKTAVKAGPKATAKIQGDCIDAGASSDAAGCFPLPGCVVGAAEQTAQNVAKTIYSNVPPPPPVCGDATVTYPEQCEPPGTATCSAACELIGPNCDSVPGSTIQGTRTVTVSLGGLTGGQKLAGAQVTLEYPQFQAGIAGSGQSSSVASKVSILQGTPGEYIAFSNDRDTDLAFVIGGTADFMDNGPLFSVAMDACQPKELNLCNRNQNIMGCCDASTDTDGDTDAYECQRCVGGGSKNGTLCNGDPDCIDPVTLVAGTCVDGSDNPPACPAGSFSTSTVGVPTVPPALEDCCPADNACVSQAGATSCSLTAAVDQNGLPIDGVTCSVVITGF